MQTLSYHHYGIYGFFLQIMLLKYQPVLMFTTLFNALPAGV